MANHNIDHDDPANAMANENPVSLLARPAKKALQQSEESNSLDREGIEQRNQGQYCDEEEDFDETIDDEEDENELTSDDDVESRTQSFSEDAVSNTTTISSDPSRYNRRGPNSSGRVEGGEPASMRKQVAAGGQTKKSQKPRRRVATLAQRRAANIRERRRMFNLNAAFDKLRKKVPSFAYEKRLSRIETLKLAIMYIRFMDNLVNDDAYAQRYKLLLQQQQQQPQQQPANHIQQIHGQHLVPAHQSIGPSALGLTSTSPSSPSYAPLGAGSAAVAGHSAYLTAGLDRGRRSSGCETINLSQSGPLGSQVNDWSPCCRSPSRAESASVSPPSAGSSYARIEPEASPRRSPVYLGQPAGTKTLPYGSHVYKDQCSDISCPSYYPQGYFMSSLSESAQKRFSGHYGSTSSSTTPQEAPNYNAGDLRQFRPASHFMEFNEDHRHPQHQQHQQQLVQAQSSRYTEPSSYSLHSLQAR